MNDIDFSYLVSISTGFLSSYHVNYNNISLENYNSDNVIYFKNIIGNNGFTIKNMIAPEDICNFAMAYN
jgi:hypothetical protein